MFWDINSTIEQLTKSKGILDRTIKSCFPGNQICQRGQGQRGAAMVKVDRVLIVATSRERLGDTAIKTGVWSAASHRPCRSDPRIVRPAALCNPDPIDSAACGTGQRNWRRRIMCLKTTATWWTLRLSRGAQSPWTLSPYVGSTAGTALSVSSERMVRCCLKCAHILLLRLCGQVTPAKSDCVLHWGAADAIAMLQNTESIALIDPESYDAIFFAGVESLWPAPSLSNLLSSGTYMYFRAAKDWCLWKALSPHVVIRL